LKRKLADFNPEPTSKEELKRRIIMVWNSIPDEMCKKLVLGMSDRVTQLDRAKGWYF